MRGEVLFCDNVKLIEIETWHTGKSKRVMWDGGGQRQTYWHIYIPRWPCSQVIGKDSQAEKISRMYAF